MNREHDVAMAAMKDAEPACAAAGLGPELYAAWRASEVGAVTERLERALVLDLAGDIAGRRVLDVGCGDGDLAVDLWRRGARVVGVDASPAMIRAARARAAAEGAEIAFAVATAERLPYPAGHFDYVTAVTILCFVEDGGPAFAEMARVLRPGGRLVIGELGRWSSWAAMRRIRAWLGSPLWRMGRFRTVGELRALAADAGLIPAPVRGAIFYPRWGIAARLARRWDLRLGRLTTVGAAFLALAAEKPAALP